MSVQMIAIEFTGVTKRFDNGSVALDGVSLMCVSVNSSWFWASQAPARPRCCG